MVTGKYAYVALIEQSDSPHGNYQELIKEISHVDGLIATHSLVSVDVKDS